MPDVFTKAKRSDVMSRIRSRGNADTELALVRLLRENRISGWRRQVRLRVTSGKWHVAGESKRHTSPRPSPQRGEGVARAPVASRDTRHPSLAVTPDFVFLKQRVTVFVDGCFWHGCPKHGTKPKGNATFWRKKFAANKARDARVNRALRRAGWRVIRIWEHELRKSGILLRARLRRTCRKAESGKTKTSTPHPGPACQSPGGATGPTSCRPDPPTRRGRSAEHGTPAVVRRIQRAIANRSGE